MKYYDSIHEGTINEQPLAFEKVLQKIKMSRTILFLIIVIFVLSGCSGGKKTVSNQEATPVYDISLDTLKLFDQSRNREVPIAIFKPKLYAGNDPLRLLIFSHGYAQNRVGSYLSYSYLTEFLASKGFFVASIQHELPTDSLIPSTGVPQIVRRPFWDRGADNILFVISELKKSNPQLDFENITLIGHSNGADMTALFPQKYPHIVKKIITLDNRRMSLPRTTEPKVLSLRSSDQPADDGVLPGDEEQRRFGITIIKLLNTKHNDMDDHGSDGQHEEINRYVLRFLNEK